MSEVEETLNRIKIRKAVNGIVIVNNEGNIIRSTYGEDKKEEAEVNPINFIFLIILC